MLPFLNRPFSLAGCLTTLVACGRAPEGARGAIDSGPDGDARDEVSAIGDSAVAAPDVAVDAHGGYGPFVGDWYAIPGVTRCTALVAAAPATSVSPLVFESCPGLVGCKRLVADWSVADWRLEVGDPERVVSDHDGPLLRYVRVFVPAAASLPDYAISVVQRLDGKAVAAVGRDLRAGQVSCPAKLSAGKAGVALSIRWSSLAPDPPVTEMYLGWIQKSGAIDAMLLPYTRLLAKGVSDVIWPTVTSGAFHISTAGPRGVAVFDAVAKTFVTEGATSPELESPRAAGQGSVAFGPDGLYVITDIGSFARVVAPATGRVVSQFAIDRARSDAIVYVEAGMDGGSQILWESPYAKDLSSARPRMVAPVPAAAGPLVANAGAALLLEGENRAIVVRMSDGVVESYLPPDGFVFKTTVWVDSSEVWLTTARSESPKAGPNTSGIVRLMRRM